MSRGIRTMPMPVPVPTLTPGRLDSGRRGVAGGWERRALTRLALAGCLLAGSAAYAPASAQELSDSLRKVVQERLEALTRRVGDSTGLAPPDTTQERSTLAEMAQDSTVRELLSLPGYELVQYRSESATFETESRLLTLLGSEGTSAVINREGLELSADSALVFKREHGAAGDEGPGGDLPARGGRRGADPPHRLRPRREPGHRPRRQDPDGRRDGKLAGSG